MLLVGPPRSGKTRWILDALERAILADRSDEVQLLVPTASMKHHLLNLLARRGLMVPSRVVSTMTELVKGVTPDAEEATGAAQDRLLKGAIRQAGKGGLRRRAQSRGLRARLSALVRECWAAGTDSFQIDAVARTRPQRAFAEVFLAFEESLRRSGLVHRNQRIAIAASRIREGQCTVATSVYIDGFDTLSKQQEELLEALAEQAEEIVVAMPEGLRRYPLQGLTAERLPPPADDGPAVESVAAASPRAEVVEIARRILASGRPLREHGIILRSPEQYADLIREVFEALRIPYRYWERQGLAQHGVARHLVRWLRAIERGFPGEETLEALASPLTPSGSPAELDLLDFAARERLPNSGLDFLVRDACPAEGPGKFLKGLQDFRDWPESRFEGRRWRVECLQLIERVQALPAPTEGASFRRARDWRGAVEARKELQRAVEDTASLPGCEDERHLSLAEFSDALEEVLEASSIAEPGQPHNVVHVLPVLESRQWSIPVTFVCGLAEGWFPRHFTEDHLFDDEDRHHLAARGIALLTTGDRARNEEFLFRVATTRATERLVLSYPRHDSAGKPVMRSGLLDDALVPREAAWARIGDRETASLAPGADALPEDLRAAVAEQNEGFSVTGITDYRQCPYLFFSAKTLSLRGRPLRPERRLDASELGRVVHQVLLRWNRESRNIGTLLDETFRTALAKLHLPDSFRTEQLRLALREDLLRFAHEQGAAMAIYDESRAFFEITRDYRVEEIESRPVVRCRIDRYEMDDQRRCFVTDYKYAKPDRVKSMLRQHLKGEQLQLMLYLAALEQGLRCEPAGMALCGLKQETSFVGAAIGGAGGLQPLEEETMQHLLDVARSEAAGAIGEILGGAIAVRPRDKAFCGRICKFGSVCRVSWPAAGPSDRVSGGSAP